MKDGKPVSAGRYYHKELADLGWFVFALPLGKNGEAASWAYENLNGGSDTWLEDVFIGIFTICIRRHEDAILFKLSWPDYKTYDEVFNK